MEPSSIPTITQIRCAGRTGADVDSDGDVEFLHGGQIRLEYRIARTYSVVLVHDFREDCKRPVSFSRRSESGETAGLVALN